MHKVFYDKFWPLVKIAKYRRDVKSIKITRENNKEIGDAILTMENDNTLIFECIFVCHGHNEAIEREYRQKNGGSGPMLGHIECIGNKNNRKFLRADIIAHSNDDIKNMYLPLIHDAVRKKEGKGYENKDLNLCVTLNYCFNEDTVEFFQNDLLAIEPKNFSTIYFVLFTNQRLEGDPLIIEVNRHK